MKNNKIGFIGAGNMGQAIIKGIIKAMPQISSNIYVFDKHQDTLTSLSTEYSLNICSSITELVNSVSIIFICVKPNVLSKVVGEFNSLFKSNQILVSIASGIKISHIEAMFNQDIKLVRIMPNTPALVLEGVSSISTNKNISDKEAMMIKSLCDTFSKSYLLDEEYIDTIIGISGSSPAYIFMVIEAMALAGIKGGLSHALAYEIAAQSVLGSAKLVLETKEHPAVLRDKVCSPSGTTIEAVISLNKSGLQSSIMQGIEDCINKSIKMSKDDARSDN